MKDFNRNQYDGAQLKSCFSTKKIPLFLFNCMLINKEKVTHEKNETTEISIKGDN